MESNEEPAERDWLGDLPDDVVRLVCQKLPAGPGGRSDFRLVSQRARRLANATVTKALVNGWDAAKLGTTFPLLGELTVEPSSQAALYGVKAFLLFSAPQLSRLVSLDIGYMQVPLEVMQGLCSSMPQLRKLLRFGVQPRGSPSAPYPVFEVISCITQLVQLTSLDLQVKGVPRKALALLQRLPNLLSLALSNSNLHDEQLAGLEGLTGLEALKLNCNRRITLGGLQALLPGLQQLTSLELAWVNLGEGGFSLLAQMKGLQRLMVRPGDGVYDGIEQLTRLQCLTVLGAQGWDAACNRPGVWRLLCSSSLQVLHLHGMSKQAAGPQVCQVTDFRASLLSRSMPLLPQLIKLEVWGPGPLQMVAVMQHTAITDLTVGMVTEMGAAELRCLALLPQLRALKLHAGRASPDLKLNDAALQSGLGLCTGLECLTLACLSQLTDQGLVGLASRLPSLRSLEVRDCDATTAEGRKRALRMVARGAAARGT